MSIPEEYAIISPIISIVSILLESFLIYYLFVKIKKIETRKLSFFIGIIISYILSGVLISFNYHLQIYQYIIFNIFCFIVTKIIYKEKIFLLDFIIIGYIGIILTLLNFPFTFLYSNAFITLIFASLISRIFILFATFLIGRLNLNKYYNLFIELWDRRDDGRIKAVTVRNISLVVLNIGLYISNILLAKIILSVIV